MKIRSGRSAVVIELLRNAWTEPDEPLPKRSR
jgi:hypothetical protein